MSNTNPVVLKLETPHGVRLAAAERAESPFPILDVLPMPSFEDGGYAIQSLDELVAEMLSKGVSL